MYASRKFTHSCAGRLGVRAVGSLVASLALFAAGCGRSESVGEAADAAHSRYRLSAEPAGAIDVITAHRDAQDAEQVVVAGVVDSNANSWGQGLAAFRLVDLSLKACEHGCGDTCGAAVVPGTRALVRVVDAGGQTVATDARSLLGIACSQAVVVRGSARRDEAGNLTILADGVYVRP